MWESKRELYFKARSYKAAQSAIKVTKQSRNSMIYDITRFCANRQMSLITDMAVHARKCTSIKENNVAKSVRHQVLICICRPWWLNMQNKQLWSGENIQLFLEAHIWRQKPKVRTFASLMWELIVQIQSQNFCQFSATSLLSERLKF
jgi:hypothetical protein